MASSTGVLKLAVAVVLACLLVSAPLAESQMSCSTVVNSLMPCVSYVLNGGAVPEACCNGIRSLYAAAKTTSDRRNVCSCIKSAVNGMSISGSTAGLAAGLPSKCGVNIPYKISPSTDCKSVN